MMSFRVFLLITFFSCPELKAQNNMRIFRNDGTHLDVPLEEIDSVTFNDADSLGMIEADLIGSWLWGNAEQGYYELVTFNEDKTYTGYDKYFTYNFDTMTYGWYSLWGTVLTLQSNGYGYLRKYNWYIMDLSENALDVMTRMGPFTYYRLQTHAIHMKVREYISCNEDESIFFADGVMLRIEDNKLHAIAQGTTYIQIQDTKSKQIYAYKVVIE